MLSEEEKGLYEIIIKELDAIRNELEEANKKMDRILDEKEK